MIHDEIAAISAGFSLKTTKSLPENETPENRI